MSKLRDLSYLFPRCKVCRQRQAAANGKCMWCINAEWKRNQPPQDTEEAATERYLQGKFGKVGSSIAEERYTSYVKQLHERKEKYEHQEQIR